MLPIAYEFVSDRCFERGHSASVLQPEFNLQQLQQDFPHREGVQIEREHPAARSRVLRPRDGYAPHRLGIHGRYPLGTPNAAGIFGRK